ncbi:MAG: hypothetical protein HYV15_06880 [Elusimicrobia bacterium]|nr:hypothetical protein [Elusimicrobiota bacterium]
MPIEQTLRERVAARGPLAGSELTRLAREAAALLRSPLAPLGPDALRSDEAGRWKLAPACDPPPEEGWDPFEAAAGKPNDRSAVYRYGAALYFAATGRPPSTAGLPFEYRETPEVSALPPGVREGLRRLLSPDWRYRFADPYEGLRLLESPMSVPRAAPRPPAVSGAPSVFLAAMLSLLFPAALVMVPSAPRRAVERLSAQPIEFLKPRFSPKLPFPSTSFADAGAAARALLEARRPSGELLRLVIGGKEHVYIRGRQVLPDAPGCADDKGGRAAERTEDGWTLNDEFVGPEALPPLPGGAEEGALCALAGYARLLVAPGPGRGLWLFHDGRWDQVRDPTVLREPGTRVNDMVIVGYSEVWAALTPSPAPGAAKPAVVRLDGASWEVFGPEMGLSPAGATALASPGGNGALAATGDRLVLLRKRVYASTAYPIASGLEGPARRVAVDLVNGRVLLLRGDGLSVVDKAGVRRYGQDAGLPAGIRDIGVDAQGRAWVLGERVVVLPPGAL